MMFMGMRLSFVQVLYQSGMHWSVREAPRKVWPLSDLRLQRMRSIARLGDKPPKKLICVKTAALANVHNGLYKVESSVQRREAKP